MISADFEPIFEPFLCRGRRAWSKWYEHRDCDRVNWRKVSYFQQCKKIWTSRCTSTDLPNCCVSFTKQSLSMLWRSAREHCNGADGARHAHKFYFPVRISYKLTISDWGYSDLGLHLGTSRKECRSTVGGSVLFRVFAAILSRSEHCTAAFFTHGAKNYTGIKLVLPYRLILGTHVIFVRKNYFLFPSVYCPDTFKRVPQIVTANETEQRNQFVRDWTETKRAKNHDDLRDLKTLQPTLAKHDNVSKRITNFEIRNGMTCRGCVSQKCINHT